MLWIAGLSLSHKLEKKACDWGSALRYLNLTGCEHWSCHSECSRHYYALWKP